MYSLIFLGIVSFVLSLILTPLVRNVALRYDLIDHPDGIRKTHTGAIPRVGGIAILLSAIGAYALLLVVRLTAGHIVESAAPFVVRLLPAIAVVFGVGLLDDILNLRAWLKLAAQVVAAMLAWVSGIHLGAVAGHSFSAPLSCILTIAWIVACTNAVNLIDGVDGLAAGIGLVATVTTLIAALLHHNIELVFATLPLAGALLGFLRYNSAPASIYLGDCGSLTVGFLLGCYGIVWSEKSTTLLGMAAPLLALSVPLMDAGLAVARRFLRRRPIFGADRGHIHHRMLSLGLAPRRVVLVLYCFCGLAAASALLLTETHARNDGFIIVAVSLAALLGIRQLEYTEFSAAWQLALDGSFRRQLNEQLTLLDLEKQLSTCITLEQYPAVLFSACPHFGFSGIEIHLDELVFLRAASPGWKVRIEFPQHGYINLTRNPLSLRKGASAVHFIDSVYRAVNARLNKVEAA